MVITQKSFPILRSLLTKYNISQKTLSEILEISLTAVSNKFSGLTEWNLSEMKTIRNYFKSIGESNITIDDIFC